MAVYNVKTSSGGGGISAVVDDLAPQLGGNLDANGNDIAIDDGDYLYLYSQGDTTRPHIRGRSNGNMLDVAKNTSNSLFIANNYQGVYIGGVLGIQQYNSGSAQGSKLGSPTGGTSGFMGLGSFNSENGFYKNGVEYAFGVLPTRVVKSADESKFNTATISDDSELLFSATANTKYLIKGKIFLRNDYTTNRWLYSQVAAPAGTTGNETILCKQSNLNDNNQNVKTMGLYLNTLTGSGYTDNNEIRVFDIEGVIEVGGTAGDVVFRWAGDVATVGEGFTCLKNSFLEYMEL